jgi:hypothetical protein
VLLRWSANNCWLDDAVVGRWAQPLEAITRALKRNAMEVMGIISPTTQAQRPGARDATIATTTLPPGSLRMVLGHGVMNPFWLTSNVAPILGANILINLNRQN